MAVRQLFTSRKWLATHALMVVCVLGFLGLGWWQLRRGEAGNLRSYAYSLEWPSFALLVVGFWAKIMYDELHPKAGSEHGDEGSAQLGGEGGHAKASPDRGRELAAAVGAAPGSPAGASVAEGDEDPELAAYNRYLADLATRPGRR
jgi:hypothetical protein